VAVGGELVDAKSVKEGRFDIIENRARQYWRLSPSRSEMQAEGLLNCRCAMAISKDLLEILVCPVCKATVELKPDQSGLKCVQCHRVYPIRDDIPVMLVDEAKIEE